MSISDSKERDTIEFSKLILDSTINKNNSNSIKEFLSNIVTNVFGYPTNEFVQEQDSRWYYFRKNSSCPYFAITYIDFENYNRSLFRELHYQITNHAREFAQNNKPPLVYIFIAAGRLIFMSPNEHRDNYLHIYGDYEKRKGTVFLSDTLQKLEMFRSKNLPPKAAEKNPNTKFLFTHHTTDADTITSESEFYNFMNEIKSNLIAEISNDPVIIDTIIKECNITLDDLKQGKTSKSLNDTLSITVNTILLNFLFIKFTNAYYSINQTPTELYSDYFTFSHNKIYYKIQRSEKTTQQRLNKFFRTSKHNENEQYASNDPQIDCEQLSSDDFYRNVENILNKIDWWSLTTNFENALLKKYNFDYNDLKPETIQVYYLKTMKETVICAWDKKERKFNVKIVNNEQKQKEMGAYYTNNFLCDKMTEMSLQRLIDDYITDLTSIKNNMNGSLTKSEKKENSERFNKKLTEFLNIKVCDPAMGSGAFLRSAFNILSKTHYRFVSIMKTVNNKEIDGTNKRIVFFHENSIEDLARWEHHIMKHMIYGVDLDINAVRISVQTLALCGIKYSLNEQHIDNIPYLITLNLKFGDSLISPNLTPKKFGSLNILKDEVKEIAKLRKEAKESENYKEIMQNIESIQSDCYNKLCALNSQYFSDYTSVLFSWVIEFPEVFLNKDGGFDNGLGFDVILSNPPWETNKIQDNEFFQKYRDITAMNTIEEKQNTIKELKKDTEILKEYNEYVNLINWKERFWSDVYSLQDGTTTQKNYYKVFLERILQLSAHNGYNSVIVPSGILGEESSNKIRVYLIKNTEIMEIINIFSSNDFFPNIVSGQSLCILNFKNSGRTVNFYFAGGIFNSQDLENFTEKANIISIDFCKKVSTSFRNTPNDNQSIVFPILFNKSEYQLLAKLYRHPKLGKGWGFQPKRELHRTEDLKNGIITDNGNGIPIIEGKHLVRYGYSSSRPTLYFKEPNEYLRYKPSSEFYRIAWRNVSNINLPRRLYCALLPPNVATVNSLNVIPSVRIKDNKKINVETDVMYFILGIMGSLVCEYLVKVFGSNNNIGHSIVKNFPIPLCDEKNAKHSELIKKLKNFTPKAAKWADDMVKVINNNKEKKRLEKMYWEDISEIDVIACQIYEISIEELKLILSRLNRLDKEYINIVIKKYSEL